MPMTLHGYWRSTASYRVRIALNLKGVDYVQTTHDVRKDEQLEPSYRVLAPQGLVPALDTGDGVLIQSPAILEWLEDYRPMPRLLPQDMHSKAIVRGMASLIACDIHPLNNLRVLRALRHQFGAEATAVDAWVARWIQDGFQALETLIVRHGGAFAFGDEPGLADCYLVPQIYSAERYQIDLTEFPRILAVSGHAQKQPAFAAAHPSLQPDADPA